MTTGLLVIDLQRGMFPADQPPHDGEAVLGRVSGLLAQARAKAIPVLHVQHDGGAGDPLERRTPGWEIHPAVAPKAGEPVIEKSRCSAFHGTDLHEQLQARASPAWSSPACRPNIASTPTAATPTASAMRWCW
jgi:nicotinamidase-related amidase